MQVKVVAYDNEFKGIINVGKETLHLPNTIVGETIDYNEKSKTFKIIESSPNRVNPRCSIYASCGGCHLMHIGYQEQLNMKTEAVRKLFYNYFGKVAEIKPCLGLKAPYEYRNKNQVVFANNAKEKMIYGFYKENTHQVIKCEHCLVQDEISDKITDYIKELLIKMHISAYDEDKKRGFIRYVMVKRSRKTEQIMVVLVTANENFPGRSNFIKALVAKFPKITTIIQNVNSRSTSVVLGDKELVIYGKGYINDVLCGKTFKISAKSFYQSNAIQTEVLYSEALRLANLSLTDQLLDAYSGVGTIGIIASDKVRKVLSVELIKDAYSDAINNAKINQIKNIHFFNDDAGNFMVNMAMRKEKVDVVIIDPPRKGSDEKFLKSLLKLAPNKIVYISCNPYSQAEDVKLLIKDYQIVTIQPVDMFPHTNHVENIVLLEKAN